MTLTRLRLGEYLAALGSAALLVALFALHWHRHPAIGGWQAIPTLRWFVLVSAILGLALAITQAGMRGPALPVTLDLVGTLVAGLTTLLLALRLITSLASSSAGPYVGLAAAALTTLGAYRAMRVEAGWTPAVDREVDVLSLQPHGEGR